MQLADALWQAVLFVEEAVVSYAKTPDGQRHLQKVASDLGVDAAELQAVSDTIAGVETAAGAVKSHFNDSRKAG